MLDIDEIRFNDAGLVPAVAQDAATLKVLMLAWMNREAVEKTIETGKAHYWSRSRGELWLKGGTSGNVQNIRSMHYDCDADAILMVVDPMGPACHTGETTCFYRSVAGEDKEAPGGERVLNELFDVIKSRKGSSPDKSYVASLYSKGMEKILAKVEEESGELIEAAREKGRKEVVYELCDLWFHTMVLLADRDIPIEDVYNELARRFGISGIDEKASRGKKKGTS